MLTINVQEHQVEAVAEALEMELDSLKQTAYDVGMTPQISAKIEAIESVLAQLLPEFYGA